MLEDDSIITGYYAYSNSISLGKVFNIYSPPTNLTASCVTSTTAIIEFTPPTDNFRVSYYAYNHGQPIGTHAGTKSIYLTGLFPSTNYSITLVAYKNYGASFQSSGVEFTTTE